MRAGACATGAFLAPRLLVGAGDFADCFGASGAHALGGSVCDDGIMNGLSAASAFHQFEFHVEIALLVSVNVFNCELHDRLLFRSRFRGALLRWGSLGLGLSELAFLGHNFAVHFLGFADDDVVTFRTRD